MSYDPPPAPGERRPRDTAAGNARCFCGSKRKYRKCCGKPPTLLIDELPAPICLPDPAETLATAARVAIGISGADLLDRAQPLLAVIGRPPPDDDLLIRLPIEEVHHTAMPGIVIHELINDSLNPDLILQKLFHPRWK